MIGKVPLYVPGQQIKRLVALPVMKRFTSVIGLPPFPGSGEELRVVDGVGLYVSYRGEVPTDDTIRHNLVGARRIYIYVEADSVAEALMKFDQDFEGARTGTRGAPALAVQPSEHHPIVLYPECSRMHVNKLGSFVCGELEVDGLLGANGGCIIYGWEPPEDCPIEKFLLEEKRKSNTRSY